jgi:hypothetical protein
MKRICAAVSVLACLVATVTWAAPKIPVVYYVVRITDIDRTDDYEVMTADEFKKENIEVRAEEPYFGKAVENVRAEWVKNETLRQDPFPKERLAARTVEAVGQPFEDVEKAVKKADAITGSQIERADRERSRDYRRKQALNRLHGRYVPHSPSKLDKERDKEKKSVLRRAASMVGVELDTLKESAGAPPVAQ